MTEKIPNCPNCGGERLAVAFLKDVVGCKRCRETWYLGKDASRMEAKCHKPEPTRSIPLGVL